MIREIGLATVASLLGAVFAQAQDVAGLKSINAQALQADVEALAKDLMLPGAMVLLETPQGKIGFGYGTTEIGTAKPPQASTHFRIASNTKTMTAATILQMVQEGRVGFGDPISEYVDGVPRGDEITISMLLKMRSGLFNFTNNPALGKSLDENPGKVWTAKEVLDLAFTHTADFAPGAEFAYNNTNYYLLGLVAEKVDGKPLSAVFKDRLFGPLGMTETSLPEPTSTAVPEPFSHGYIYGGASYALADAPYPPDLVAAAKAGTLPDDETWQNPSAYFAAGGAISTADDLAAWMQALAGGKVLDANFQKQWLDSPEAPVPGEAAMQKYGYGILTLNWAGNTIYYHEGEMPGYQSFIGRDLANGVTLVIWTNLTLDLDGAPTANTLMVKILDEIYATSPLAGSK